MAHRAIPPPKPAPPVLTPEQKRYRIERLRICIRRVEDFDPQAAQMRLGVPDVLRLETSIDQALSGAFGYGTPAYLRYNLAARLDGGTFMPTAALHNTVLRPVADRESHGAQEAQEARRSFSKERSIGLLQQAIAALEHEVAGSPTVALAGQSEATRASVDARSVPPSADGIKAMWYRLKRRFRTRPP
jgi:hypothetical protein